MDDIDGRAGRRVGDQGLLDDGVEGGRAERVDERDPAIHGSLHRYQTLPSASCRRLCGSGRKGAMSAIGSVPQMWSGTWRPVGAPAPFPETFPRVMSKSSYC